MTRAEILLNFIGRGTLIGMKVGGVLITIIMGGFFIVMGLLQYPLYMLYLFIVILLMNLVLGGLFGGIVGLVLGLITALRFDKTIPSHYAKTMIGVAVLLTFIISIPIYDGILASYSAYKVANPVMVLICTSITSLGAMYGGNRLTKWYIKTQQCLKRTDVIPESPDVVRAFHSD